MRFDWYACSIPATIGHCKQTLFEEFDEHLCQEKPVSPYKNAFRHIKTGMRFYWGGHNPLPYLVASGDTAPDGARFMRERYPAHRVSRADVAFDFIDENGFDKMVALIEPIARDARVEVCFQGDPDPAMRTGRTMYYGSSKSDVRICLYEKGLHQRLKGDLSAPDAWCRLELRVRPRKDRKSLCARLTPLQLWSMAKWTTKVAETVFDEFLEFTPDKSIRKSSVEESFQHMISQYGSTLVRFADAYGAAELMARIRKVLEDA